MTSQKSGSRDDVNTLVGEYPLDFSRMLYMLYQDMEFQITRADTKAQIILSANAVLLAALAGFGFTSERAAITATGLAGIVTVSVNLLVLAVLGISIYFALSVAFPRMHRSEVRSLNTHDVYYSGLIASLAANDYVERFNSMSLTDVKHAVMVAIHAKASVLQQKFIAIQRSITFMVIAGGLWMVSRIVLMFF